MDNRAEDEQVRALQVAERLVGAAAGLGASREVFVIACIDAMLRVVKFDSGCSTVAALDELIRLLQDLREEEGRAVRV